MAWIPDFDGEGDEEPSENDEHEDVGDVAEVQREEYAAVEHENGDLSESQDGEVEYAVNIYQLLRISEWDLHTEGGSRTCI